MSAGAVPVRPARAAAEGTAPSSLRRRLYAALGILCVGLGAIGVVVPGLPTTVFLLAACWLFARSCPRLETWLRENRVFGAYLRMASQGMPRRAKVLTIGAMWTATALSVAGPLAGTAVAIRVAVGLAAVGGTWAIACRVPGPRRPVALRSGRNY